MRKKLLSLFVAFAFILIGKAQPGCPEVTVTGTVAGGITLPCGTTCTNLSATYFNTGTTTTYSVDSIAYNPFSYTTGTIYLNGIDDEWGGVVDLPFNFCFFDSTYNKIVIGSNGLITFDTTVANLYNTYVLTGHAGGIPTNTLQTNSIMGPYQDIDPAIHGHIYYQTIGTSPCRIFIISFTHIPMYSCTGKQDTNQIALYETTNAIEVYNATKPLCTGWNGGLAIEGIQNQSGTVAFTVPGRDNTQWSAHNDAWRFTPTGTSIVSVNWSQGSTSLGTVTGDSTQTYTINVCPPANAVTPYVASATYSRCDGTTIVELDTVNVITTGGANAGPDQTVSCFPTSSTATMAATGVGTWTAVGSNPGSSTITTPGSPTTTITGFSVIGTYKYLWTSNGCTDTAEVTVTGKPNAGPDQTVSCVILPGGSATMAAAGTGTWTAETGNPGTAVITTATSPTTTITGFSAAGLYNFIWTVGGCTDTAAVIVTPKPNAGPDQSLNCISLPGGTVTMGASGLGFWSASAGNPGTATITSSISPTTTITSFSAAGTYQFIWSIGICTDTALVTITAAPDAGPDQTVACFPLNTSATMAATGTGIWTAETGNPGTAVITAASDPTTTINGFSTIGTYHFIWTNGSCADTAAVFVTANPNAGPDQVINCAVLPGGSVTMGGTGSGNWSAMFGNPGAATITAPASATTTITGFTAAGIYSFIFSNGGCADTAQVNVTAAASAGPDQILTCVTLPGGSATMAATGIGSWIALPGNPGTSSITSPTSPTTTITTFSAAGIYYFQWSNGSCADTVTVTISTQPDAGPDQTVSCYPSNNSATMAATGTGTWSAQAGNPGSATITTPANPITTITNFSTTGTYTFVWSNGNCTATATVTVTASPNAGPDQTVSCVTLPGGSVTMAATGTGTWSASGNNPGSANITSPSSANTTITTFSAAGTYYFVWTNGGCTDTAAVTVTAKPNAGNNSTICQNATASLSATGTGSWSALPTNPAVTTITSPANAATTVNGFTSAGTYGYVWTVNGCTDTALVFVTPTPTITPTVKNITCNNAVGIIYAFATGTSPFTYQWSNASSADSITTTSASTTYAVTVTDANQCTASATASVSNQIVSVSIADSLTNVSCYDYKDGQIILYVNPAGQYTYSWSNGETTDTLTGLAPGTYTVNVTDPNGCSSSATYTITQPGLDTLSVTPLDTLITLGDTIQLNSYLSGLYSAITYSWTPTTGLSCSNCPSPVLVSVDTNRDVYQLVITYNNGCTVTDSAIVTARPHDLSAIPDAFTPNGDGKNDVFVILATSVKDFKMNIYNRWGQQVFSTNDITKGWDGSYKGNQEPEETYMFFYSITYLDGKVENKEGSFMLFR